MSKCCIVKAINVINAGSGGGGGSLNTLYSADANLVADRVVGANGNDLTFNMGSNLFTVSGVVTTQGVTLAPQTSNPGTSETVWSSGSTPFLGSAPLCWLPVATETSGAVTAALNYLTPINTTSATSTVTPPTASTNARFEIVDSRGNAGTNAILINFSGAGQKLYGVTDNFTMNFDGAFARFRYLNATIGWIVEK